MSDNTTNEPRLEMRGILHVIHATQKFGDLYTRKFWLSEKPSPVNKYPQVWQLELWHDDTEQLLTLKKGDPVKCIVAPKGKIVTKKGTSETMVINTLLCRLVEKISPADL